MYRNKFDKTGECAAQGQLAENAFFKILSARGQARAANQVEQRNHIDFILLNKDGKTLKYDVKSRKKINRDDDQSTDDVIWIEFLNVRGDRGWIYGESDYIVFEREKDFLVVDRLKLMAMAETKCDLAFRVRTAADALYRNYQRFGRNDCLSLVKGEDVVAIADEIIPKTS